ncbi:MAG: pyridoxal phosphate-dependent class II aminotransferase [Prevotella sp.]|jgi:threonine-phosphate decarboxylase|nr:pyridoxal phosphate-dependent class II aminotransferase [Prevotella sp.]
MILGHGDDIYTHARKIESNFSSNIYSRQDMSALQNHLCAHIDAIHSYPEPDAFSLANLLAEKYGVDPDNICVTNGATEAIYLIAQAFSGVKSAIIYPAFSEYGDAAAIYNHTIHWAGSLDEVPLNTELVWLCNPNNPTGTVTDKHVLKKYIESHPSRYIIIDQSYEYFTTGDLFDVEEAAQYKNVMLLHSMTKHYAIPGLRLGYISAHADILAQIAKYRMPWSVNGLAIEAGKFLLNAGLKTMNIGDYLNETKQLREILGKIERITVYPTDTHFFLCKFENGKASDLKKHLIDEYGILIRDAANFYGLDEQYFRIATQSREENEILINGIKKALSGFL